MKPFNFSIVLVILLAALSSGRHEARAAEPIRVYEGPAAPGIPIEFMRFHNLEKAKNYGESWYFFVQNDDGAIFFASLAVTNLGLHTFDSTLNATFVPPGGKPVKIHKEFGRKELKASATDYDVQIGRDRAWGAPPEYHLTIDEKEMKADVTLSAGLPAFRRGDGLVRVGKGGARGEYGYGINAPCARASGTVTVGGTAYTLAGAGYHDHSWQTLKMTDIARKTVSLRLWHGGLTLDFQDHYLKDGYGGGKVQVGLVGRDGKIIAELGAYALTLSDMKKVKGSPYEYPGRMELDFNAGGVRAAGTLTVDEPFQSLDMLADLSWPVRMAVRAFYGRPWVYRMRAHYELTVTIDGKSEKIQGEAIPSMVYY